MSPDDLADDLLAAHCLCRGTGVVHVGAQAVPCPDCGDV